MLRCWFAVFAEESMRDNLAHELGQVRMLRAASVLQWRKTLRWGAHAGIVEDVPLYFTPRVSMPDVSLVVVCFDVCMVHGFV